MGDGQIQGEKYEAKSEMVDICSRIGWNLFDYSFSLLDQTSKSFQKSYRTLGKKEHILVFKKGNKL
jgi:site-specific DNA-methyltransferase (cytosine-N4-specific)